ncbi:MAG: signal peptidase I [Patescibacteria group bacterium]
MIHAIYQVFSLSRKKKMKALAFIKAFFTTFFLFLVLVVGVLVYVSGKEEVFGWRMLIVKSGSMEPKIKTGSLIFDKQDSNYSKGDVVTFGFPSKPETLITHRILEVEEVEGKKLITTKGDFNQIDDKDKSDYGSIVGKYVFGIPYIGYVIDFAKTPPGVVILVIVPGTIIIYDEFQNIKKHVKLMLANRKHKKEAVEPDTITS